jgi:phosphatidate cytidylyltransferase
MALNWQTFRTRALTAIVFVAVMLAGLLWNHWSFFVLFSIIHFGCWWEYFNLQEKIQQTTYPIYTRLGFMLLGYGLLLWCCGPAFQLGGYAVSKNFSLPVSAAGFGLAVIGIFQSTRITLQSFGAAALGLVYISLSWALLMNLYETTVDIHLHDTMFVVAGNFIPIITIASIWINDTMAYIVGSFIGKTPLSKISPKKTWEGTIGGIILAVLVMGFAFPRIFYPGAFAGTSIAMFIMPIAAIAAITGTIGDLIESKLKRMAGVKDSGSIMPGHGGFLDRFDSLLFAVPFVWIYVQLFLR